MIQRRILIPQWCKNKSCTKYHCARNPIYNSNGTLDGCNDRGRCPYYLAKCNLTVRERKVMGV